MYIGLYLYLPLTGVISARRGRHPAGEDDQFGEHGEVDPECF